MFLSMLVRVIALDLPLWHRILVLEILRVIPTDLSSYEAKVSFLGHTVSANYSELCIFRVSV